MKLRDDYDQWHARIHAADEQHDDAQSPWYQLVSEYARDVAGQRILEVGCGRGGLLGRLARGGARVSGCDFSMVAVAAAKSKLARQGAPADLLQAQAEYLPFRSEVFDAVVSCETIEHVPDAHAALREMYRVTRPGGRLFLTTPNYANFMGLYDLFARVRHPQRRDDQPYDRRQIYLQVRKWVRDAGWRILATDGTVHQFPFFPGRNPVRWHSLESQRRVRKLLSPFALTYFVMCEKS